MKWWEAITHFIKTQQSNLVNIKLRKKIYIAGQEGMVGKAIYKILCKKYNIIDCPREKLELTNQLDVQNWFKIKKPDIVINAAGKVGGILDNSLHQPDYIYQNTLIGFNLLNSSLKYNVNKFINLGSACIYPKFSKNVENVLIIH